LDIWKSWLGTQGTAVGQGGGAVEELRAMETCKK